VRDAHICVICDEKKCVNGKHTVVSAFRETIRLHCYSYVSTVTQLSLYLLAPILAQYLLMTVVSRKSLNATGLCTRILNGRVSVINLEYKNIFWNFRKQPFWPHVMSCHMSIWTIILLGKLNNPNREVLSVVRVNFWKQHLPFLIQWQKKERENISLELFLIPGVWTCPYTVFSVEDTTKSARVYNSEYTFATTECLNITCVLWNNDSVERILEVI